MAKKPGTNPKGEFAFFNVFYEDDSQRSNRRVPSELRGGLDDRGPGDDEDVPAGLERGRHHPERLPESATDPVADHRTAEGATGGQSEAGRLEIGPPEPGGKQRMGPGGPAALERREVLRSREHHEPRHGAAPDGQAVSRFRPRARRAARMRRPPAVRIRARKPCSLARWRFFG